MFPFRVIRPYLLLGLIGRWCVGVERGIENSREIYCIDVRPMYEKYYSPGLVHSERSTAVLWLL